MNSSNSPAALVLVDGSSYLYRAYHALPPLTNSKGEPTGAVYGVINMLRKLMQEYEHAHIAVVFDAKGKTFRDELFDQYKAHRPPMPDDLRSQVEPLHAVVKAMGLPLIMEPGVEADDVIATLALQAAAKKYQVVVSTGDKDLAQIVNDRITLINTMSGTSLDPQGVVDKYGVSPKQIIDYLALVGDSADNVPGVPKVGAKTAAKWLAQYESLDNIVAHAEEIKGKVGESLRQNLDQLALSKALVTIKCDVSLSPKVAELSREAPDREALIEWFKRLEFKTWLSEQLDQAGEESAAKSEDTVSIDYQTVLDNTALKDWIKKLKASELFAFDTETTSLDYMQAELVGVSIAVSAHEAAYIPLAHSYEGAPKQLPIDEVLSELKPLLEDPKQAKLGQHLKYDRNVLMRYGITLDGIQHDTMLQSYVLDSTASRHDMDTLALKYLGYKTTHFEDVAGKGVKQITFDQVHLTAAAHYAAEDADVTLQLHETLWPKLTAIETLRKLYEEIEIPLIPVLSTVECNGVLVDAKMLAKQSKVIAKRMKEIESEAHELAGGEFNLGSPKQLQTILFEKMSLPVIKKTPKGQPSTAEEVLQELALDYPLPKLILEYRGISKLKSTYTDRLPEQIDDDTGRIHTSYHQAVAATGRLSSTDPNLQNIPIRTEQGRAIRKAFIAPPGYKLLAADYSQIELRIMAHISADPGLMQAFTSGDDVHRATAAEVFGVGAEEVSADQRRSAKAINFGLIYGMSAFGLARQLGIERNAAQAYVDLYFSRYTGVKEYMEQTRQLARDQGYVETVFGRRLYLPEINSRNFQRRQYAERTAINAPMQGTAADIIKMAMLSVHEWILKSKVDVKMIMQVHDELVFEVAEAHVETAKQEIQKRMGHAASLSVPLLVEVGIGDNWDEAH